eukprot:CAMPEP_0202354202 /NCGR_PEP_ID=MMETSP1126-20121109/9629_1 /ASSEMBLY_ACC=CAM_ASM_000457 /TAXON_ID=3047 /ORGANISM="Dunaliella tertiolecta, Strain CCMP1320" /LENGTH=48 /DNA_ID= /DNA_START= /DNA_END= /DNA_ORIENTATION=
MPKEEAPTWQWHRLLSEPAQRGGSYLAVAPPPIRACSKRRLLPGSGTA